VAAGEEDEKEVDEEQAKGESSSSSSSKLPVCPPCLMVTDPSFNDTAITIATTIYSILSSKIKVVERGD